MSMRRSLAILSMMALTLGCSKDDNDSSEPSPGVENPAPADDTSAPPAGVFPPSRVARPVFIQPYENCKVVPGVNGAADETICTQTAISGATRAGKKFAEFASCQDVRTQRFFAPIPPENVAKADDPKLADPAFMKELDWVTNEVRSTGCACCHDSASAQGIAKWDISSPYVWTEQFGNRGLAIMAGEVGSATLGAFPRDKNHGFDRSSTGAPSTDPARMKAFFLAELTRRKVSKEEISKMEPLGGRDFIAKLTKEASACPTGSGVDGAGKINWQGAPARYIYLLKPDSKAPIFPPNLDIPEGTIYRLDVAATAKPLASGVLYGSLPEGTKQRVPEAQPAPALVKGETYWLYTLLDVGFPIASCTFVY